MAERIVLKSPQEIELMREGGAILRDVMDRLARQIQPGMTTRDVDEVAAKLLHERQTPPAFLGMYGFPGTVCLSVNDEIVHGIPGDRVLKDGDIISIDCGLIWKDFYLDTARTVPVGNVDDESARLLQVTQEALEVGIEYLIPGLRMGDLSAAVQRYVEERGFSVVREYTGHGIGRKLHEEPKIPNWGSPGKGIRWQEGMVVCIEPMVNAGACETRTLSDNWTVATADGKRSAHMEHTVAIGSDGPMVLT